MPYVDALTRARIDMGHEPLRAGELNYKITTTILDYMSDPPTYGQINEVIGVLECAKLELYRRIATPYEDRKIVENGDVY